MFGSPGMGELLVIPVIGTLVFGVNKIPQIGKGLGEGIENFKSALKAGEEDANPKAAEKRDEKP
jgi:sec-independent protein translocase protein TatA